MSEAIPGVPPPPPPSRPRDAAVVILYRRLPEGGVEVFWIKRENALSFAGGFYAFPGGALDASDAAISLEPATSPGAAASVGPSAPPGEGDPLDPALRVAAARELLEETGVLVGAGAEGVFPEAVAQARRELLDGTATFAQLLDRLRVRLRADDFRFAGRYLTPPMMPRRFDARMYLVEAPAHAVVERWPGELAEGAWIRPQAALERWEKGTALLHPPQLYALKVLATFSGEPELREATRLKLADPPHTPGFVPARVEFQRGIRLFPLETATLPPATHTNCYLLGNGEMLIVDPGSTSVRECARLFALVEGLRSEGRKPTAVLLTHHHQDHVGGAKAVKERLGLPVWCHERTADRLPFTADRLIADGEVLVLKGVPAMRFQVLHTPGHARGHLVLVDEASRAAIVGDMVAGLGTILIDPPEGDMVDYLAQLARLRDLPVGAIYPSHGPAIVDGPVKLTEYLRHREMRERKVLETLTPAGATLAEIVPRAYDDVASVVYPIAERSTLAILIKLVREDRAGRRDDRYYAVKGD